MIKIKQLFDEITKQKVYPITTLKAVKDPKSKKSLSDLMIVGEDEEIIGELGKRDCDTLGGKYKSTDIDSAMTCDEDEELGVVEDVTIVDADRLGGKYTADNIDEMFSNCYAKLKVIGEVGCIITLSDGQSGVIDASGSIVFSVYYGEYTIQVTKGGSTSTYTVTVDTLKIYELAVVVGFNITNWLRAGKISTDYASVSEIPEKDIRQLMTIHASVDYLVENIKEGCIDTARELLNNDICAKWINLRDYALDMLYANPVAKSIMDELGKYGYGEWALIDGEWQPKGAVPVMTSNTAPYGTVTESSVYSGNYGYLAFNGNAWSSKSGSSSQWICYEFVNPICVRGYYILSSGGDRITDWKLQASNDKSTWVDLDTKHSSEIVDNLYKISNNGYYKFYRIYVTGAYRGLNDNGCAINKIQFYGRQLNVSVPVMTSNTAPWGEASASGVWSSSTPAYNAFSGNVTATYGWFPSSDKIVDSYVEYNFGKLVFAKTAAIFFRDSNNKDLKKKVKVCGSVDGVVWEYITENIILQNVNTWNFYNVGKKAYKRYRLYYLGETNSQYTDTEGHGFLFNIFGVDYSEREFEEGSTMKYIYDHGVELEEIIQNGSGGTFAKNPYSIECNYTSTSSWVVAITKTSIDLTPFSLIRCNTLKGTAINGIGYIALVKNIGDALTPVYKNFETSLAPNNQYCDISSVNEGYYIDVSAGSGSTTGNVEFSEWWLE